MSRCLRAAGSLCVVIELVACSSPTTTAGAQAGAAGSDTGGATSSGGTNTTGGVPSVGGSEARQVVGQTPAERAASGGC